MQASLRAFEAAPSDASLLATLKADALTYKATSSGLLEVLDEFLIVAVLREEVGADK
jgi:hypothetical protein